MADSLLIKSSLVRGFQRCQGSMSASFLQDLTR